MNCENWIESLNLWAQKAGFQKTMIYFWFLLGTFWASTFFPKDLLFQKNFNVFNTLFNGILFSDFQNIRHVYDTK